MLEAILGVVGRILGFVLEHLPVRGDIRMRLDVHEGWLMARAGSMLMDYDAGVRIYNRGRHRVTVREAGWIAGDGEKLIAGHGESTLDPGDPEDFRRAAATKVLAFAQDHRGLRRAFVQLAGEDKARTTPVTNAWMAKVRELAAKPMVTRY